MKTYFLQVKDIVQESAKAISIHFWHPISEQIKYKAGQFITITVPDTNSKKIRRSYSMSSSPNTDSSVAITIKRVENGVVSNYLNDQVKKGDFLEVLEPMGNFYFDPETHHSVGNIILIAAGSGITPLISIAKTALKASTSTKVFLLYGNRNQEQIIFKTKLAELEDTYRGRFEYTDILSNPHDNWVGLKGRINQANATVWLKDKEVDFKNDQFYLCGPVPMMDEIKNVCEIYNVPKNHLHIERFNAPIHIEDEAQSAVKQTIKIKFEGKEYDLTVEPHQTILEAALEKDIDLPYSCQAGMCTACMGKCTAGSVEMDEMDGLTEKEIKQGYILTCVSHPKSADVVVEI